MNIQREIRPDAVKDRRLVEDFLRGCGLSFDGEPDYTVAFFRGGEIIGTGSLSGRVLRNIAVADCAGGEGLMLKILTALTERGRARGIYGYQLFTRPQNVPFFRSAGFQLVAEAPPYVALLEIGPGGLTDFCAGVKREITGVVSKNTGALVMNCNPFTLGHRYLAEYAARRSERTLLFVVEEDRSAFSFADRLRLVREGVADLPNVQVFPGGEYIISNATFPSYFLKKEEQLTVQTLLDATVFADAIAPALGITARYLAEEPEDAVTGAYNQALLEVLPSRGITVEVIGRLRLNGAIVSASKVRRALIQDDWAAAAAFLPACTLAYLRSCSGLAVIDKLKQTGITSRLEK